MCGAIPFLTTWAVLVNSFTLVVIAVDRYVAVGRVFRLTRIFRLSGFWCTCIVAAIWGVGAAVSAPMALRYVHLDVFVVQTNAANRSEAIGLRQVQMCLSEKAPNLEYFTTVFAVLYGPTVVVFVWLNVVIALEIWRRRRPVSVLGSRGAAASQAAAAAAAATSASCFAGGVVGLEKCRYVYYMRMISFQSVDNALTWPHFNCKLSV